MLSDYFEKKKNVSWTLDLLAHQDTEDIFRLLPDVHLFLVIFFCKVLIEYLGYWMSLKEEEKISNNMKLEVEQ